MKNFELDEMGQVNSQINNIDQIISPNNGFGLKDPIYGIELPYKAGMGINIGNYQSDIRGNYTPGRQLSLRFK